MGNEIISKHKQRLKINPRHIDFVNILQMPGEALEQKVNMEVADNSFLEIAKIERERNAAVNGGEGDYPFLNSLYFKKKTSDEFDREQFLANKMVEEQSLYSYLESQISVLFDNPEEYTIAEYIITNVDTCGFFYLSVDVAINDLQRDYDVDCSHEMFERILKRVQTIDPPGVCARDLRECFLIQLERMKKTKYVLIAHKIIREHWDDFSSGNRMKINHIENIPPHDIDEVDAVFQKLNSNPAWMFSKKDITPYRHINPDFIVRIENGEVNVELLRCFSSKIKVRNINLSKGNSSSEDKKFLKERYTQALTFWNMIRKREESLLNVMNTIVEIQHKYFLSGDIRDLVPMKLNDIVAKVSLHISIISRIVNNKIVETQNGKFLLKNFFSKGMVNKHGEKISTKFIKEEIEDILHSQQDKVTKKKKISDSEIVAILESRGINIARRTVNKYRHEIEGS